MGGRQVRQKPSAALEEKEVIRTASTLMLIQLGEGQAYVAYKE